MSPEGERLRDVVLSWPLRQGLRTSDLLDVEPALRAALLGVLRRGGTTPPELADALGVPVDDALELCGALADRGVLTAASGEGQRWSVRPSGPERQRPRSRAFNALLDDLVDGTPSRPADPPPGPRRRPDGTGSP